MQDFRKLKVWEKAHNLTLLVYQLTMNFPKEELFGLRTQLRKTCVEIPAYIAEGCGKPNDAEFARCLHIALSFANRLEYYVLLAFDLEMFAEENYSQINSELIEVKKMLNTFSQRLR